MTLPSKIILTGFMGTGKTAVGQQLASDLAYPFIDTDALVESSSGKSIERIFAEDGEDIFRRWESQAIDEALKSSQAVISVGGGAICLRQNFDKLRKKGCLILLKAQVPTILKRLVREDHRPLLKGEKNEERVRALLAKRATAYERVPLQISTDGKTPAQIAREIRDLLPLETGALRVKLGERSYPLYFQKGALDKIPLLLQRHHTSSRAVLVTDKTVDRLYGKKLLKILKKNLQVDSVVLPAGEKYKTLKTVAFLYSELLRCKVDRKTPLIALGGGVMGDIVGFAAATYLRGIPFVQIPTTLLAQVDSSIGGKTGVDLPQGKNLVGAFYQPKFVLIDENFLSTLSPREFVCGLAEVIKYAAIFDGKLFRHLEEEIEEFIESRGYGLEPIIRRCCELKAWVVEKDERETLGIRSKLNFGHTLGHAIESLTAYKKFTHGEAIAIGMAYAAEKSVERGLLARSQAERLKKLLARAGLPFTLPPFKKAEYRKVLIQDKKRVSSEIHFVYLSKIGKSLVIPTPVEEII
jgi:shikimate kinase / 3-dehydroquinate synthase